MALRCTRALIGTDSDSPRRYCGRNFTGAEIEWLRGLINSDRGLRRAALSRIFCEKVNWIRPDGRLKDMSCRVAMLRMERDGLIKLPPPRSGNGNGSIRPPATSLSNPRLPLCCPAGQLGELALEPVRTRTESRLWNELIERHHYLGYTPVPGAQIRYLVYSEADHLLAALGFGASAWQTAARDTFIGWTSEQRQRNLHLVVNNSRFLIMPWITCPNLASRILGAAARRLPGDWSSRYNYRPAMLETFVETGRFRGTCYRAANWLHVGQTTGRGKLEKSKQGRLPIKDVFLLPIRKNFRLILTAT
jgi:hypothetical protein